MMTRAQFEKFSDDFEAAFLFEIMEIEKDESFLDCAKRNLKWIRSHTEDGADSLEGKYGIYSRF